MSDDIGREFAKAWVRGVADAAKLEKRLAKLEAIVRRLAAVEPVVRATVEGRMCGLCDLTPAGEHRPGCPWRQAKELLGE